MYTVTLLVLISYLFAPRAETSTTGHELIGKPMPVISGVTLDGDKVNEAWFQDKVVVLHFWFVGCLPCANKTEILNALYARYSTEHIIFLGVGLNDSTSVSEWQDFLRKKPLDHPFNQISTREVEAYAFDLMPACPKLKISRDRYGAGWDCLTAGKDYKVKYYPTTFLIDRKGLVRNYFVGSSLETSGLEGEISESQVFKQMSKEIERLL